MQIKGRVKGARGAGVTPDGRERSQRSTERGSGGAGSGHRDPPRPQRDPQPRQHRSTARPPPHAREGAAVAVHAGRRGPGGGMSQSEVSPCAAPPPPPSQRVFQEAVRRGNTKELQSLLQNMTNCEFNVNSFGPEGQTALHQSVIDGNLELVKLLVKFGADIRLANRDGWSALHIAAFGGHQDIVLYLITKAKYSAGAR
ncbi:notch-regulated ankyrin repeat-containing protein [Pseudopipra pipra]|uniref:notch-regulated ankyrin repeat-containing protein n=1 Tax=Pseudopipra pipra TaxID=415032 RepID=UPI003139C96A